MRFFKLGVNPKEGQAMLKKRKLDTTMWAMLLAMFFGYVLLHTLFGGTLFDNHYWDSYTVQAMAWRDGRVSLGQDYPWLELAVYNGDWYVSFPPTPSLVAYPLTFLFGSNVPSNLLIILYTLLAAAFAYKIFRFHGMRDIPAAFMAVFTVWGCNMMWMSTVGGVWFLAQGLNMLLCLAAVYCAFRMKRTAAFTLLAFAVGCRPFSILYYPALLIWFAQKDDSDRSFFKKLIVQWKYLIPTVVIGALYMLYNYVRFDNVLEFGHNYLPEFTESEYGQFHLSYLKDNLYNLFVRPITFRTDGSLEYPIFNGFLFYIANPIFIVLAVTAIGDVLKKRMNAAKITLLITFALHILALCVHKTLGGWQFGARYTADLIPFVVMYLCCGKFSVKKWIGLIGCLAVMLNVYGAVAMHFLHG